MNIPSIFNDVLGPIMIGPSSSHVAAASRIGKLARAFVTPQATSVRVLFAFDGSLVTTYHSQGTDMGFACGLLDMPPDDPNTDKGLALVQDYIPLSFEISDQSAEHPSDYHVIIQYPDHQQSLRAVSSGGGTIRVYQAMGAPVQFDGGTYELLALCHKPIEGLGGQMLVGTDGAAVWNLSATTPFSQEFLATLAQREEIKEFFVLPPVMPVLSFPSYQLPFENCAALYQDPATAELPLSHFARAYEMQRSHTSPDAVSQNTQRVLAVMKNAVNNGLIPHHYPDRILQSQGYLVAQNNHRLIPDPTVNKIIAYVSALMESKSAMFPVVAAPTAGSCGCLAGTLLALGEVLGSTPAQIENALLAAGLVGVFFTQQATFAAEEGGCQMECGAGSGMAAAALAELMGAPALTALSAASMAMQGITGLACDPVASRVEVPCLNKNIMGGVNALASANMALAGFAAVVPLHETIDALYLIGKSLPLALRCTCGGLGCTPTSECLLQTLAENARNAQ